MASAYGCLRSAEITDEMIWWAGGAWSRNLETMVIILSERGQGRGEATGIRDGRCCWTWCSAAWGDRKQIG